MTVSKVQIHFNKKSDKMTTFLKKQCYIKD